MNKNLNNLVAGIALLALVVSGVVLFRPTPERVVERVIEKLGAVSGPNVYQRQNFQKGFQSGGSTFATSSSVASAYTLLASDIDENVTYISWNAGANLTLTSMASTSLSNILGNDVGDTRSYLFYNATSSAGTAVTFAAGTGVDLQEDEGTTVIVNGLEIAKLTFVRKADSDVILWVQVGQVGD